MHRTDSPPRKRTSSFSDFGKSPTTSTINLVTSFIVNLQGKVLIVSGQHYMRGKKEHSETINNLRAGLANTKKTNFIYNTLDFDPYHSSTSHDFQTAEELRLKVAKAFHHLIQLHKPNYALLNIDYNIANSDGECTINEMNKFVFNPDPELKLSPFVYENNKNRAARSQSDNDLILQQNIAGNNILVSYLFSGGDPKKRLAAAEEFGNGKASDFICVMSQLKALMRLSVPAANPMFLTKAFMGMGLSTKQIIQNLNNNTLLCEDKSVLDIALNLDLGEEKLVTRGVTENKDTRRYPDLGRLNRSQSDAPLPSANINSLPVSLQSPYAPSSTRIDPLSASGSPLDIYTGSSSFDSSPNASTPLTGSIANNNCVDNFTLNINAVSEGEEILSARSPIHLNRTQTENNFFIPMHLKFNLGQSRLLDRRRRSLEEQTGKLSKLFQEEEGPLGAPASPQSQIGNDTNNAIQFSKTTNVTHSQLFRRLEIAMPRMEDFVEEDKIVNSPK